MKNYMFQNVKKLNDFYFISNVCTGDYINMTLNIQKLSPMNTTSSDDLDFIDLMNNYQNIDFDLSKSTIISYKNVKVVKFGYSWYYTNKKLGVDTEKTFAIEYPYKTDNSKKIQLYYRHYEYNNKSINMIQRRINRYKITEKIPFFIFHYGDNMCKYSSYEHRCAVAKLFSKIKTPYKLFISKDCICLRYIPLQYKIFSQAIHNELIPIVIEKLKKDYNIL